MTPSIASIAQHRARFDTYSAPFLGEHASLPLRLKYEHTTKVLELAERLVQQEAPEQGLVGDTARAVLLSALYHDIGRFSQFTRWRTFQDKHSTNHGTLAVRILKGGGFLDEEPTTIRHLVLTAVGLHNRYHLPAQLPERFLRVTHAVRDADKVDIFRIMATHLNSDMPSDEVVLSVRDEPEQWSPVIVQSVLEHRMPSYNDLRYFNDFRLLLASWLGELHYASSRELLACSGHVEAVLAKLPMGLANVRDTLLERVEQAKTGQHEHNQ